MIKWICYIVIAYLLVVLSLGTFTLLGLTSVVSPRVAAPVVFAMVFIATPSVYRWIKSKCVR